jgi:hypothetical protein
MLTFNDVKDRLKQLPEIDLLEVLDISSEDLVEAFEHNIYVRMDELIEELEDDQEEV